MKVYLGILRAILVIVLTGLSSLITAAQESSDVYVLRDDALFTLTETGMQVAADLQSLGLPVTELHTSGEPRYVASADLVENPLTLYVLIHQGQLSAQLPFPTQTQILGIDVETQTSTVIYDRSGIFTFVLSPDGQQMIVGYYEDEYYFSEQRACVLDLQTYECDVIPHQITNIPGRWIDNVDILVLSVNDLLPHIINRETGEDRAISLPVGWNLSSGIPVPNTRTILLTMGRTNLNETFLYSMFIINIDTMDANMLIYERELMVTSFLGFSPDNRFLLYRGNSFELIELSTGRSIITVDRVINFGWESNNTLVFQGILHADDVPVIARINAETGTIQTLAIGDQAAGILIVP